jgi:rubredoxin
MKTFEGSFLGDSGKIGPATRLECKVCWHVYDPAEGDPLNQVPPGTPFAELPSHWLCPHCENEKAQFMVLPDD